MSKLFAALLVMLESNHFDSFNKLFLDLFLAKFLDTSAKVFFHVI